MKRFQDLGAKEVLALAIDVEYRNAERLKTLADLFTDYDSELREFFLRLFDDEIEHAARLEGVWAERFGEEEKPLLREADIREVVEAVDVEHGEHAIFDDIKLEDALRMIRRAEEAARAFYLRAADATKDERLKKLYCELADIEGEHLAAVSRVRKPEGNARGNS